MSYITDLRHFLNEDGEIPGVLPRPAKELASFLALVVDAVTAHDHEPKGQIETGIRCRAAGCSGEVIGILVGADEPVEWYCPVCGEDGQISGWQESRWDNLHGRRLGDNI